MGRVPPFNHADDCWSSDVFGWRDSRTNCFFLKVKVDGSEWVSFYRGSLNTRPDWIKASREHVGKGFCPQHGICPSSHPSYEKCNAAGVWFLGLGKCGKWKTRGKGKYCDPSPKPRCEKWSGYVCKVSW